ncbi:MAG: FAD-binding protein [Chloroflexi bacterium]|nr:FAD-binding protein [Chloroflexota bacterium]
MTSLDKLGEVIETDVLVIGGGLSGLRAAIAAKDRVQRVTVVDKGFAGKAGHAKLALGTTIVVMPEDDLEEHLKDLVRAQESFIDYATAGYMLERSYEEMKLLEGWGVDFLRTDGKYQTAAARGCRVLQNVVPIPGGEGFLLAMFKEASRREIDFQHKTFISDLLVVDGQVVGAVGTDVRTDEFKIFLASATILCTNTIGYRGHYPMTDMVGDGPALAYSAGAEIVNAEFNTVNSGPTRYPFAGTGPAAFFGAKLRNAQGEAIMDKHSPEMGDKADLGAIALAMAREIREGNNPLFFDFSTTDKEGLARWRAGAAFNWESVHRRGLAAYGLDVDKREWMPVFMYSLGALKTDFNGQSNLKGLFAAGKARTTGIELLTGWSFTTAMSGGFQAGDNAGKYALGVGDAGRTIDSAQVANLRNELFEPLSRNTRETPDGVTRRLQEAIFPYDVLILKNEASLTSALQQIQRIRDEDRPGMAARDVHELIKLRETENMILNAELMLRASLIRKESRAGHFREDYPLRDDANWLKWIALKKDGEDGVRAEMAPFNAG